MFVWYEIRFPGTVQGTFGIVGRRSDADSSISLPHMSILAQSLVMAMQYVVVGHQFLAYGLVVAHGTDELFPGEDTVIFVIIS